MAYLRTGALALAAAAGLATASQAAVVGLTPGVDLGLGAYVFTVGGGAASYTFSDSGVSDAFGFGTLPAVRTGGTGTVASLGAPFFDPPRPSTFFTDEGRRPTFGPGSLGVFLGYLLPAVIDATTDSYVGLKFTLGDGDHYGFARLAGLSLSEIAYETVAGVAIDARPGPYGAIPAAVPLPASLPLLFAGVTAFGAVRVRRRTVAA